MNKPMRSGAFERMGAVYTSGDSYDLLAEVYVETLGNDERLTHVELTSETVELDARGTHDLILLLQRAERRLR